ncbi:putative autophagy-related protein 11 [Palaemon carinicauda]|uniref:putative autophagy-related protein 11 n=1 Tax=Palaemon carinicauda TaxID=392227 RepID=UPI0035B5A060
MKVAERSPNKSLKSQLEGQTLHQGLSPWESERGFPKRLKMSESRQVILVFSFLLLASSQGLDLRHSLSSTTHVEAEVITNWQSPLEMNNGKAFFSNGIRWTILPEASLNSSSSEVIPEDAHCEKEGLNAVAGSCQTFVYCKDLSNEGLEDWYVLLFTCPEGHVFEESSGKCEHHSAVDEHDKCQPKTVPSFLGVQDLTKQDIMPIFNFTGKEKYQLSVKSSVPNDKDSNDDAYVDSKVLGKRELTIKRREISENAHQKKKPLLPEISKGNNASGSDKTLDFLGKQYFQERKKRSVSSLQSMWSAADIIAENTKEACQNIKSINDYVNHIMKQGSFKSAYPTENFLMSIIEAYNQILKAAQMNTNPWKEEKGILKSVKEIFNLAKEFEPKLKKRFLKLDESVDDFTKSIKTHAISGRINDLLKRIKEAEALMKNVENTFIREFLNDVITEAKSELINLTPKNLINILAYALSNAKAIKEKSSNAVRRMETFRGKIIQDHTKFIHSISRAQDGKRISEIEKEKTLTEIRRHKGKKQASEREIQENKNEMKKLIEEKQRIEHQLQIEMRELDRRAKEAHDRVIAGGVLLAIFPIVGAVLLGTGVEDKKRALHWKSQVKNELEMKITILNDIVAVLTNNVASENQRINSLERTITFLESRSTSLQIIYGILQNLEKSATSVNNSITRAMSAIVSLTNVFSSIEVDLIEMKNEVDSALSSARQLDKDYFLFENINEKIIIPWDQAKDKIIAVGECITE